MSTNVVPETEPTPQEVHENLRRRGLTPGVVWMILRRTFREFIADRCTQMASAIAYGALFAAIPMTALAVAAFGFVVRSPEIRQTVIDRILANLPVRAGLVVDGIRQLSAASPPLTVLGTIGLVWTTMSMFAAVRDALNVAWGARQPRPFAHSVLYDLAAAATLGALLGVSLLGTAGLHALRESLMPSIGIESPAFARMWEAVGLVIPATTTYLVFLLLYRYVPNVDHGFADVWPGALVAMILFEIAKHGFAFYVANFNRFEIVYGALGAVMLFLLWVYVSAIILLLGAEMASVYEKALRGRATPARPAPDLVFRHG